MVQEQLIYEGKTKKLFKTSKDEELRVEYLDQATALNGLKKDAVSGKGALNNQITKLIFQELEKQGIPSHFIKILSKHEQLVCEVEMIPLEIVVRILLPAAFLSAWELLKGSSCLFRLLNFITKIPLDDPFINEDHIRYLGIATPEEVAQIKMLARQINTALCQLFEKIKIHLVDFKIRSRKK